MLDAKRLSELDIVDQLDQLLVEGILRDDLELSIAKALFQRALDTNCHDAWEEAFFNSKPTKGSGVMIAGLGTEVHRVLSIDGDDADMTVTLVHDDFYKFLLRPDCQMKEWAITSIHEQQPSLVLLSLDEVFSIAEQVRRGEVEDPAYAPIEGFLPRSETELPHTYK